MNFVFFRNFFHRAVTKVYLGIDYKKDLIIIIKDAQFYSQGVEE